MLATVLCATVLVSSPAHAKRSHAYNTQLAQQFYFQNSPYPAYQAYPYGGPGSPAYEQMKYIQEQRQHYINEQAQLRGLYQSGFFNGRPVDPRLGQPYYGP